MPTPRPKKFVCVFCKENTKTIDYKDAKLLAHYITYYRSIQSRFHTGVCLKHQKMLATAIKRARQMALLSAVRYDK